MSDLTTDLTPDTLPMAFAQLQLAAPLARAVADLGYESMTPIQAQAIPMVLQGRDVMGAAQTGFQMLSGTLTTDGTTVRVEGKVLGEEIILTADGKEYRGRLQGRILELR